MRKLLIAGAVIAALLLGVSCSDDDKNPVNPAPITGSGNLTTVVRTVPSFSAVHFQAVGDLRASSGTVQSVSITVDDNVVDYISTSVTNGALVIAVSDNITVQDYDLAVDVTMTDLEEFKLSGVGNIVGQSLFTADIVRIVMSGVGNVVLNLDAELLSTVLTGVGNIELSGSVRQHDCTHSAVGNLESFSMSSDTSFITLSGVGSCNVRTDSLLDVMLTGAGSVSYKGYPTINATVTGSGSIVDAN